VVDLARRSRTCDGRPVGIYPETKHPTYFASIGLPLEQKVADTLHANHLDQPDSPMFIQSFEPGSLQQLNTMIDVPLVQLINCTGQPFDFTTKGDARTYADLVTAAGQDYIATYADGVGVCKDLLIPRDADGRLLEPSAVIDTAHDRNLIVHGWTFRRENRFLPLQFRSSTDPEAVGDLVSEIKVFLDAGMDGFFTDNPDLGRAAAE
jgi:glycerophosphoryl diester phosphodiesterase